MSWRTVVVTNPAKLDLQVGFLQIRGTTSTKRVILDEIDILLVESTAVSITAALLAELIERKVKVIFCDRKHLPLAELVAYRGCHDSSRRIKMQLEWSPEMRAQVWQMIVTAKIQAQAAVLRQLQYDDEAVYAHALHVEINDQTNREALAARVYFTTLFGKGFTRESTCPVNAALDYGYQLLLAVFARELTAEGYILQLGIFHNNTYNGFNLASDLMEPFRPFIDRVVHRYFTEDDTRTFDIPLKRRLVEALHESVSIGGTSQTLINAAILYTRRITENLSSNTLADLFLPKI